MLHRALIASNAPDPGKPDVCATHALVLAMLGDDYQRPATSRELWAIPTPNRLLVQYPGRLDLRWLPPHCHLINTETVQTVWRPGTQIMWAAIANPTTEALIAPQGTPPSGKTWTEYCNTTGTSYHILRKTKRTPIKDNASIIEWARAKLAGIEPTTINIGRRRTVHGQKRDRRVTLWTVHLTGTGIVGNTEAWEHVLANGIGDGKAYGCGLVVCSGATQ